jgi:hypothetical protein
MNRPAIEVGAFPWGRVQRLYDPDLGVHWSRCCAQGLVCPLDVFAQLFRDGPEHEDFTALLRAVDWGRVRWELTEFSGVNLRRVSVDRSFQHAVDEARSRAAELGVVDAREEVSANWRDVGTWVAAPVIVSGTVLGSSIEHQLLVGYTRLGSLLGLLDRAELPALQRHLVWVGRLR